MKKVSVLVAVLLGSVSSGAKAADIDIKVPFAFVVHGQTLPAGQYRIENEGSDVLLLKGEHGTSAAMFVLATPTNGTDPAGDTPAMTFAPYETGRQLTNIWESRDEGFAVTPGLAASAAPVKKTTAKTHVINGVVKSIDASSLTISRPGKKSDLSFALDSSTGRGGTIEVGTPVSVRYKMQGTSRSALYITARPRKNAKSK